MLVCDAMTRWRVSSSRRDTESVFQVGDYVALTAE
jgi:hypothetical protein